MSTVHCHALWSTQNLVCQAKSLYLNFPKSSFHVTQIAYSPKDRTTTCVLALLANFCELFENWGKIQVTQHYPLMEGSEFISWRARDIKMVFEEIIGSFKEKTIDQKIATCPIFPLNIMLGDQGFTQINSTPGNLLHYFDIIKEISFSYINKACEDNLVFPVRWIDHERDLKNLSLDLFLKGYAHFGLERSLQKLSFNKENFDEFEIKAKDSIINPEQLSGIAFTLLNLKEKAARDFIFFGKDEKLFSTYLIEYLMQWGYRNVPSPNAGDVLVYFLDSRIVHTGLFTEEGKVHSKLGKLNPYTFKHNLFDFPPNFGESVCFFRKSSASISMKKDRSQNGI